MSSLAASTANSSSGGNDSDLNVRLLGSGPATESMHIDYDARPTTSDGAADVDNGAPRTVSYTHLTLPTIYSV